MMMQVLPCPHCQGTDIIRHRKTRQGKQHSSCQGTVGGGRTFLVDDSYAGHSAAIQQQIVDMALNASGMRDTTRVLHGSPTTVIKAREKKRRNCSRCILNQSA
jgi:transposase-like protein